MPAKFGSSHCRSAKWSRKKVSPEMRVAMVRGDENDDRDRRRMRNGTAALLGSKDLTSCVFSILF